MLHERQAGDEFSFIEWIRASLPALPDDVLVGVGDDCAVIRRGDDQFLLKVDTLLEGRHFQCSTPDQPGYASPRLVGGKAICRALSDIAAMGGVPRFALVAVALPEGRGLAFRQDLFQGVLEAARRHDVALVGGDTKSWEAACPLSLGVTVYGEMRGVTPVLRSGGRPGDILYVTGELGGSILERHTTFLPRLEEGRWLASFGASAMIDLSDGLSGDLWQLAVASGCGARLVGEAIPISAAAEQLAARGAAAPLEHALHDGEDFELLFSLPAERAAALEEGWPFSTRLTRIGELLEALSADDAAAFRRGADSGRLPFFLNLKGVDQALAVKGYEHRL